MWLTEREKEDSTDIIRQVREILAKASIELQVRIRKQRPGEKDIGSRGRPEQELQEKALDLANAHLEAKAQEIRAQAAALMASAAPGKKPEATVAEKTLWERFKALVAKGWQITVGAVLEWATGAKRP
jgi:hypothetical protein